MMNPEVKKKWLEALRSGEYKQGKDQLKQEQNGDCSYCCLGVLCDLFAKETGTSWDNQILKYDAMMPTEPVRNWAGVSSNDEFTVDVDDNEVNEGYARLDVLNDRHNYTFAQIADLIEKQL